MILIARSVSPTEFGTLTLVFAAYGIYSSIVRSVTTEPLVVRFSAVSETDHQRAARAATGAVLTLAVVGAGACFVVGKAIGGMTGSMVVALAVILPGLLLQDAWRSVFFAGGRPAQAAANELVWMFVQVVLYVALFLTLEPAGVDFLWAWGAAASVAAVVAARQSGFWPAPHLTMSWWNQNRDLGQRFAAEQVTGSVTQQATVFAIAGVAGLASVSAIRGAQLLVGPLNMLALASSVIAVPEGVRVASGFERLRRGALLLSAGLLAVAVLYTAAALFLPESIGQQLLGDSWRGARSLLVPVSAGYAGYMASIGARVALRALGAASESLRAKVITSLLGLVFIVTGATVGGGLGAAVGIACAGWLQAIVNWAVFNRVRRIYQQVGAPPTLGKPLSSQ